MKHSVATTEARKVLRVITYDQLKSFTPEAILAAQEAFCGQEGLGALAISGVPNFSNQRQNVMMLGAKLALDPESESDRLACAAEARVAPGWAGTPGCETHPIQSGFYADLHAEKMNMTSANSTSTVEKKHGWGPNRWPKERTEFSSAFISAGSTMHDVVLKTLDIAGAAATTEASTRKKHINKKSLVVPLRRIAEDSTFLPARLVYYDAAFTREDSIMGGKYWLPWHIDFNLATAFAPAMWLNEKKALAGNVDDAITGENTDINRQRPELDAGLLLRNTKGDIVPASLSEDCILVQLGAYTQITSGGLLRAGPHAVSSPAGTDRDDRKGFAKNNDLGRLSFGLFVYGPWDSHMLPPDGYTKDEVLSDDDFGGLMQKAYTGDTILSGFRKFAKYMNFYEGQAREEKENS